MVNLTIEVGWKRANCSTAFQASHERKLNLSNIFQILSWIDQLVYQIILECCSLFKKERQDRFDQNISQWTCCIFSLQRHLTFYDALCFLVNGQESTELISLMMMMAMTMHCGSFIRFSMKKEYQEGAAIVKAEVKIMWLS